MTRWGKAGERLSDDEARRRWAVARQRAAASRKARQQDDEVARRLWEAGEVKPYRITTALNARGLYGPDVDTACGAREPDVDLWEAGKLYPTWEQLRLLAKLVGVTPRLLCTDDTFDLTCTSLRFHFPDYEEKPTVWSYPPDVVEHTVARAGR